MRIAQIEVLNFRGIKDLTWAPSAGVNCLIGPGDSTKTTILDALELCLNPRSYSTADDCDFFNLDVDTPARIIVTLIDLPKDFIPEDRYGRYLRGWSVADKRLEDEPRDGLQYALSILVTFDKSLEMRWSILNDRIATLAESDPPSLRFKDWKLCATTRLGPYAERHLAWGRTSVLSRANDDAGDALNLQLAEAARAARSSFTKAGEGVFKKTVERAELLGKKFAVPVRGKYAAELDVQGVSITSGGIALHDNKLPLRRLGCGSARLLVSALQHDTGTAHIALIDEVEHGLEPHRLARLLRFLRAPKEGTIEQPQIFMTTHSPVVIQELAAADLFAVRCAAGATVVRSVSDTSHDSNTVQRHMRSTPEAFLASKIIIGEGRTEQGLIRGFDAWWSGHGNESFAFQGVVAVDGRGKDSAPLLAAHLRDLGYRVYTVLDSDEAPNPEHLQRAKQKGAVIDQWTGGVSTEQRLFLDLPWGLVGRVVREARLETINDDSAKAVLNNMLGAKSLALVNDLELPTTLDSVPFRTVLGSAAKAGKWFKGIFAGERIAAIVAPSMTTNAAFGKSEFSKTIGRMRSWVDG